MKPKLTRSQRDTIVNSIAAMVGLLLILQLWLLTATMNAWLGRDNSIVWPAAFASLGCFIVNLLLIRRLAILTADGD